MCNEIEGSYDKIIITIVTCSTNITHVAVGIVTHAAHNIDGNKLMLSSIALYYGGACIELYCGVHFSGEIHRLFYCGNVRSMEQ